MGDTDERAAIRERKRQRLLEHRTEEAAEPSVSDTTPEEPIAVEDATHFDSLIDRYDLVLVDYHADWCGPCQMLAPIVSEIARDTPAVVAKVDIDRHRDLAGRANVQGVPTMILYVGGEPRERLVGVHDKGTLLELIDRFGD